MDEKVSGVTAPYTHLFGESTWRGERCVDSIWKGGRRDEHRLTGAVHRVQTVRDLLQTLRVGDRVDVGQVDHARRMRPGHTTKL